MSGLALFERRISRRDLALLRSVSHAGGERDLRDHEAPSAALCELAGFLRLENHRRAYVTGDGHAYLDLLMRVD